jgi:hypothetical protein
LVDLPLMPQASKPLKSFLSVVLHLRLGDILGRLAG